MATAAALLLLLLPLVLPNALLGAPGTAARLGTGRGVVGKPPNVVILFLDDHGWGDVGANAGAAAVPETPHIDALAASGARFTDFHSGYSVCTASRAALLTGRLAPRTGVFGNFAPTSSEGMALQERTIADVLGGAGYDTHMIGALRAHTAHIETHVHCARPSCTRACSLLLKQ
jgi:arylsulfatase A-like enzyme